MRSISQENCIPELIRLPPDQAEAVQRISQTVRDAGGTAMVVGGAVRDALLGMDPKDADVEVFGLSPDALEALLRKQFRIETVGRSFGVFLIKGLDLDVAIPRKESKQGSGHRGFDVEGDPALSFREAASRRDFTVNAISWNPLTGDLVDPWCGRDDLRQGILRHVSPAFREDPLRVLRAMQFSARFDWVIDPATVDLCRSIEPEGLAPERQFEEWRKLLLRGRVPSRGLHFLAESGWIRYYPELQALEGCPQDSKWHPEGDVWTHTLHCLDAFAPERIGDDQEDLIVGLAVLLHDVGKPLTTVEEGGRIRSPAHDVEGLKPARTFLERLTAHRELIDHVLALVETHMRPAALHRDDSSDSAVRRLARTVGRIDRLVRVSQADAAGRPPLPPDFPAGPWLLERARSLDIEDRAPRPILMGRHLLDRGMKPGPAFGPILDRAYEAQLNGDFSDLEGALAYLDQRSPDPS